MGQQMRRALLMAAALSLGAPALVECISVLEGRLAFGPQQPRGGSATAWTAPRTPWGHPDLQGYWTNTTTTPLQRPVELKDKATLSGAELAERDKLVAERANQDAKPRPGNPGTYTRTWTAAVPMVRIDGPIFEYACHEGNYGMGGILRGARADEQAVEGAANRR